ncbi:MAG: HAMP domain-containing sensor histidine kinase [Desulfurivibrio sp.]|nr:HAMP domain-containing sensor histidine kinase [Desulfurivibrio sp.]
MNNDQEAPTAQVVAVRCDQMGIVREIARDDHYCLLTPRLNHGLPAFFYPGSELKARHFLQEINTNGIALDWEFALPVGTNDNSHLLLSFIGIHEQDKILLVGALKLEDAFTVCQELLAGRDQQFILLQEALNRRRESVSLLNDQNVYDAVTSLNNELLTVQRSLVKKGHELEVLNEQKNIFMGVAAHDLRNPIGNIISLCEMLQEEIEPDPESDAARYLEMIKGSSNFMLRLLADLLDFVRIESGQMEMKRQLLSLKELVVERIASAKRDAGKKELSLLLDVKEGEDYRVAGDYDRLSQVVDNLLTNAIKFSRGPNQIVLFLNDKPGWFVLSVRDHGQGISLDEQEQLFKPFKKSSTVPTAGERSTGLGLSIVKLIVEGHGGSVDLESEPGEGTTISVNLPKDTP